MKNILIILILFLTVINISFSQDMLPYPEPLEVEHLRGDIYLIKQNFNEAFSSGYYPTKYTNNLVLSNQYGSLIVDSDDPAASIDAIFEAVSRIPYTKNGNFDYLISTHWHLDHTGLNHYFNEKGAEIIGHWNESEILLDPPFMHDLGEGCTAPPVEGHPTEYVAVRPRCLKVGREIIKLIPYLGGHSNTDIVVYFKKSNIIHLGDLSFGKYFPFIDRASGGNIKSLIRISKEIYDMIDDETIIIPGHGVIINKTEFNEYILMLEDVQQKIQDLIDLGMSEEDVVASKPLEDLDSDWGWLMISGDIFTTIIYRDLTKSPK